VSLTKATFNIAGCRLRELYREACRLYPCLHAVEIVDRSPSHRIGRDELRKAILEEMAEFNEYVKSSSIPGAVGSESTARYYMVTCVALGLLERLGDVSARPDFLVTPRGTVLALAQKLLAPPADQNWQLGPILKFFTAKILWEDDGTCFGALIRKLGKKRSLSDLYRLFSTVYRNKDQFFHIMKPHVEWLVDLGLLERQTRTRDSVFVKSTFLETERIPRGLSSSDHKQFELPLSLIFLKGVAPPSEDEIDDYVRYSYRLLETQGNQLAGDYVSVSTLLDGAQLLMTLGGRFARRGVVEKTLVKLMDANRDHISSMEAMTEETGLGSPVQYGPVRVAYLRFIDKEILRPRRTPDELSIDGISSFLGA
jgi:hypothetical protein